MDAGINVLARTSVPAARRAVRLLRPEQSNPVRLLHGGCDLCASPAKIALGLFTICS
jgi:hypothetical protein